jgi:hypothetical protein
VDVYTVKYKRMQHCSSESISQPICSTSFYHQQRDLKSALQSTYHLRISTPLSILHKHFHTLSINMPLSRRAHHTTTAPHTTRTTRSTTRPSLKTRLLGPKHTHATTARRAPATTTTTTTTTRTTRTTGGHHAATAAPVHHHKRHATMGDKVSGALMKLKGSLTHKPGVKAAGTRRMHGTDGRGARHVY